MYFTNVLDNPRENQGIINFIKCNCNWYIRHLLNISIYFYFRFSFYDGPPFATGLPHYGHILTGAIKDVVTRYAHQTGHHVERRFGWDTHGLPVVELQL